MPDLRDWFKSYRLRLLRFVNFHYGENDGADDVVQDVFERCLKNPNIHVETPFSYLCKIARNVAIDKLRRQRAGLRIQPPIHEDGEPHTEDAGLAVDLARLREALTRLPPLERRAAELWAQRMPISEIQVALGIDRNASNYRIRNAIKLLEDLLNPEGPGRADK
jgi:RNA polymerase sigma factor (sigma-70 family)